MFNARTQKKEKTKIRRNKSLMDKDDLELKKQENDYLQEIFYNGSSKKGSY